MMSNRGISLLALAAVLGMSGGAQASAAQSSINRANVAGQGRYDIASGDLRGAISQFSQASGLQVVVAPKAISGRHTAGLRGSFAPRDALDHLLRGTG
jgi:type II secretory pathway component GspD/PulD (secretin)